MPRNMIRCLRRTIDSMTDSFIIAGKQFRSRLIVGTGKYKSFQETARALEASGADMVTVAVRRVNLDRSKESLLDYIDPKKYFLLPNTAGCYTADETIRTARLAREVGLSDWIKLEVIGDQATLFPDVQATLEATRMLVKEGFTVLAYTSDDIVFAKRLVDAGASAVMPLGRADRQRAGHSERRQSAHPARNDHRRSADRGCGSGHGFRRSRLPWNWATTRVLMNTGIAGAQEPVLMAEAMKHAVHRGTAGVPGRKNAEETLRDGQFAAGRRGAIGRRIVSEAKPRHLTQKRAAKDSPSSIYLISLSTASSRSRRESCRRRCVRSQQRDGHSVLQGIGVLNLRTFWSLSVTTTGWRPPRCTSWCILPRPRSLP